MATGVVVPLVAITYDLPSPRTSLQLVFGISGRLLASASLHCSQGTC